MITDQDILKILTDHLLAVIQSDYSGLADFENKLKSVKDLTPEQARLIDMVDHKGSAVMSKAKAIDLLAKISGLNSSTPKLAGTDGPLELKFSISYTDPNKINQGE